MEKALTKYFWIFNLVALALLAFLSASGTNEMIAAKVSEMLPDAEASLPKKGLVIHSRVNRVHQPDGSEILKRNIFDSLMGPITPMDEMDNELEGLLDDQSINGLPLVPCTSQVKLLATVASPNEPEWSFANVSNGKETDLYRVGDELDGRVVSGITWRFLLLRGSVDECYIDLFNDPKAVKKPRKPRTTASLDGDLSKGISVDGPNERTVDRSLVDQALANPTKFARSVRVRPYKKNGEVTGFRLRRIQKGSPLALLGAKKGDIIHSVNGVDLTSVDQALIAYQNLRSDNRLIFSVTRKGKPLDLNINIR